MSCTGLGVHRYVPGTCVHVRTHTYMYVCMYVYNMYVYYTCTLVYGDIYIIYIFYFNIYLLSSKYNTGVHVE